MIERFKLHDNVLGISTTDFGRVMGLKNTNENVEHGGSVQDEEVRELVNIYCINDKKSLLSNLAEKLEK